MTAAPLLLGVLCIFAIAYRYYSAFLAAQVAVLDDSRTTPAVRFNDGRDYHPTNKWVLFGHHFAAISGAGPLVGPVLAAQFGYLPGLLWIVIGVCLAGAVQDFLMLAASVRRGGRSLAQIAFEEIGPVAGTAAMIAILFIIVIALAGLGKVVVKALGGERNPLPDGTILVMAGGPTIADGHVTVPADARLLYSPGKNTWTETISTPLSLLLPGATVLTKSAAGWIIPNGTTIISPGSSWGTFTIASTIPIALFVGLYMSRLRKGKVVEASLIGAVLTLGATAAGGWVAGSSFGAAFNLRDTQVIWAIAIYGFIAAVLPVWLLLVPRDYLSSFLKIGTIAVLVIGTLLANPKLQAPPINHAFLAAGPMVAGPIFPFLFITIMCGAISGFHALVSSGTTPKMLGRESDARTIGYGAMLIEGLVGVVAMIAAASLPPGDYYAITTDRAKVPAWHDKFASIGADLDHLNIYDQRTQETLRGRSGGAVTLAVGMAYIFDQATRFAGVGEGLWKYWYHFAIMFEALFILTTIDAGTRIGRFLLQEVAGKIHAPLGRTDWLPGSLISTLLIVTGWAYFITSGSFDAIWSMFGVANQMLAVIALAVLTAILSNEGKSRYLWVTLIPMLVVGTTTTTAALELLGRHITTISTQWDKPPMTRDWKILTSAAISGGLIVAMLVCTAIILFMAVIRTGRRVPAELRQGVQPAAA